MKISDYGFLSDCQSAALVSRRGSVDWYCVPRFDSPSVFGRLLDPQAGHWSLHPRGDFSSKRSYADETLVLTTTFRTGSGSVEVTDAMALHPSHRGHNIGREAPHLLLRSVRGIEGSVEMVMELVPRFEYGLTHPHFRKAGAGIIIVGGPVELRLISSVKIGIQENDLTAGFTVAAGDHANFSLSFRGGFRASHAPVPDVEAAQREAAGIWKSWSDEHENYEGLYPEAVRRSAVVLQGLTFQPSGSLVAAATTSLPEILGGGANWDYRYSWLRDASLTMRALWIAACPDEPQRFFDWISRASGRVGREAVQIMYGVEGERDLSEHTLDNLTGFEGSKPVRIGNDAWRQKQLDVLGEVLNAAYILRKKMGKLDAWVRDMLIAFADHAASSWKEPDAGIWEARDRERHYTLSKIMCWVALDRAVRLAGSLGASKRRVSRWSRARDDVHRTILKEAWNDDVQAYTGAFGSDRLDAALLLAPIMEFLPSGDERMRATIDAISNRLAAGGLVRRWQEEENGFVICTYWLVECLAMAGRVDEASELFERVTAKANDLGLLSEMIDSRSGVLLGNFPQAFSHVGLINAAWRLTQETAGGEKKGG